jgi:hypothetical protein
MLASRFYTGGHAGGLSKLSQMYGCHTETVKKNGPKLAEFGKSGRGLTYSLVQDII